MDHQTRWTSRKIAQRLALIEPLVYRRRQDLPPFRLQYLDSPHTPPPLGPGVDDADWPRIQPGDYWGEFFRDFILRLSLRVPQDWDAGQPLALYLPLGEAGDFSHPEALVYLDEVVLAACDRHHQEVRLPASILDGQKHRLELHGWVGLYEGDMQKKMLMRACQVVQIHQPTRDFIAQARAALGIADQMTADNPLRGMLYSALDEAFKRLDTREPFGEGFYASLESAAAALAEGIAKSGPALEVDVTAAGHAHIDVAWLWPLGQTRRKTSRTFANVLSLMQQYPQLYFTQSQPQLYDFIRQDHPELFEAIRQRVQEGRWEPLGGMWVEADCNLSGAESLARQFLLGRSFFREHFGPQADTPVLWLPDVFGYAWNLPQLIREAGMKYFFTIKIGWNQYNRLPYDSFWWQGLDGTRVLTHFSTTPDEGEFASTYNAMVSPKQVMGTWTNFRQKEDSLPGQTLPLLMSFGYGDGGGGPTREMVENAASLGDFPGSPRVHFGRVSDFYAALEAQSDRLPTWNGELYLEYHRGTYTTQSRNKRANRKSEFALHDAEFLAALAAASVPDYAYPAEALHKAWELVCLNQFHDILPGSSIAPVYMESQEQYAEVARAAGGVTQSALEALGGALGGEVLLVNPTSFERRDLAFVAGADELALSDGAALAAQPVAGGWLVDAGPLPPYSLTNLGQARAESAPQFGAAQAAPDRLENDYLLVQFNPAGDIVRLYDKQAGREVLPLGAIANQLQAFEDRPMDFDAWNIEIYFDDKLWLAEPADSIKVVEHGPLRAGLEIRRRILNSELVQHIYLDHNSPQLTFETTVQWRERHILLKTAFPVDVLAPKATYEIQWGNVERPTHRNTSWDWARFETCAHKWVDLSEGGYGVSLLNDCKYGHDIHENVIRLSLLRSPTLPDPQADLGQHTFTYALLPHSGGWDERTIQAAYALNDPLIAYRVEGGRSAAAALPPLVQVDLPNAVIETIKQAEDGRGMIVRLYETQRKRGMVTLRAGFPLAGAWRCNLLEEDQSQLEVDGSEVRFELRPYQIVTLRLVKG